MILTVRLPCPSTLFLCLLFLPTLLPLPIFHVSAHPFPSLPSLSLSPSLPTWLSLADPRWPLQAEAGRTDLELAMTKLRAEEASLRDALSKLSALNESLAQDKRGLNHLVAQVCPPPCPPVLPAQRPQWASQAQPWLTSCLAVRLPEHLCPLTSLSRSLPLSVSVCLSVYPLSWSERKEVLWTFLPSSLSPVSTAPSPEGASLGCLW